MTSLIERSSTRIRLFIAEYDRSFWILSIGQFIDQLGGTMVFPFFTLYISTKFGTSMTEIGLLFGLFSVTRAIGSTVGGALADTIGRRTMLVAGLVLSAFTSLGMGLAGEYRLFILAAIAAGLFASIGNPAGQAMVADLLPPDKRAGGFAIQRVVFNLAVSFGPAIGGLLAAISYLYIFAADALSSTIMALIVFLFIKETMPEKKSTEEKTSLLNSIRGYKDILQDKYFSMYMIGITLVWIVLLQMNVLLAPYLWREHAISPVGYGFIMTLNATMVILFQYAITKRLDKYNPLKTLAVGIVVAGAGFTLFGVFNSYALFMLAMVVVTIGEMITMPPTQVMVAQLAPEDMRGRYMAVFGYSWMVASAVGPMMSGFIMDNFDPRILWYVTGLLGVLAASVFMLMVQQVPTPTEQPGAVAQASAD